MRLKKTHTHIQLRIYIFSIISVLIWFYWFYYSYFLRLHAGILLNPNVVRSNAQTEIYTTHWFIYVLILVKNQNRQNEPHMNQAMPHKRRVILNSRIHSSHRLYRLAEMQSNTNCVYIFAVFGVTERLTFHSVYRNIVYCLFAILEKVLAIGYNLIVSHEYMYRSFLKKGRIYLVNYEISQ